MNGKSEMHKHPFISTFNIRWIAEILNGIKQGISHPIFTETCLIKL